MYLQPITLLYSNDNKAIDGSSNVYNLVRRHCRPRCRDGLMKRQDQPTSSIVTKRPPRLQLYIHELERKERGKKRVRGCSTRTAWEGTPSPTDCPCSATDQNTMYAALQNIQHTINRQISPHSSPCRCSWCPRPPRLPRASHTAQ